MPTGDQAPDANETYRKLLAAAPDKSVTVVTVGFTTNLRRLLETKADALVRECREELAVGLAVDDVFMAVDHEYPDIHIRLTLFNARIASGTLTLLEHVDAKWILPSEIDTLTWCPADAEILAEIRCRHGG